MPAKLKIDLQQVEDMAAEFCTQEEIAMDMGFDRTIFQRRMDVRAAFLRGKNSAKTSLRHMLWVSAKNGDRAMLLFLAKNELGYRDNPEPKEADDDTVQKANEQIVSLADMINKPVKERTMEEVEAGGDET